MAPGRAPDRPGRLPPAVGHAHAARRGAAAHQRAGQRAGHPGRPRTAARYAEKYAHLRGLPYGRVDISTTEYPGQLVIEIRDKDPSVKGIGTPAPTPWPSRSRPPTKDWFPAAAQHPRPGPDRDHPRDRRADDRDPVRREGGKAIGVYGMTGSGKIQHARRRPGAGHRDATTPSWSSSTARTCGDELTWEPLAAATACGPAGQRRGRAGQRSSPCCSGRRHLVTERSATAAETGESVFQPTPEDPAVVVMVDEVDEVGRQRARLRGDPGVPGVQAAQIGGLPDPGHASGPPRSRPAAAWSAPTCPRSSSATPTGPPNPGTPPAPKQRSPTSASTPAAARATSRSGTPRPRRSPPAGARSCSGCPRTSWPTASASWTPAGAPGAPCPALDLAPVTLTAGSTLPKRQRRA